MVEPILPRQGDRLNKQQHQATGEERPSDRFGEPSIVASSRAPRPTEWTREQRAPRVTRNARASERCAGTALARGVAALPAEAALTGVTRSIIYRVRGYLVPTPGMLCSVGSLCDAVPSYPRNGVTVPQHVLHRAPDSRSRRTFVPGFRVALGTRETWHCATNQSHHSTACPPFRSEVPA